MGKQKERDNVEGRDLDGTDCGSLKEIVGASLYWITLARDEDKWRDLVNTVMNIQVP
jgi:hypothetical protein